MPIKAGEQLNRLAHGQLFRQTRFLQRNAQQLAQLALMALPRHAQDFDFARGRREQTFEDFDGGGLAGAVRPEQTEALAGLDVEIQSADRLDLSVVGLL